MHYIKKYKSVVSLTNGFNKKSGRNNKGKITTRHHGGGHKQAVRQIDWKRSVYESTIIGLEYDPKRNVPLAKLYNSANNYSYILATEGTKLFQKVYSYNEADADQFSSNSSAINEMKLLQPGDCAPISFFEVGDFIHAVEAFPGQGSIFSRSAGSFCQIRSINQAKSDFVKTNEVHNYAIVRLPSGAQRYISIKVKATLGMVYLINKTKVNRQKAGRRRWLGWRPSVRGVAMNPVDHPHGGGQGKTSGGRPSVTFKSWPTKGRPTRSPKRKNSFILKVKLYFK
jgi:large subunit ribosomal protein L2